MDSSSSPRTAKKADPNMTEAYIFYYIIRNIRGKMDVNWEGVAEDAGFKNGEVAKVRYGQIRRKLGVDGDNAGPKVARVRPPTGAISEKPSVLSGTKSGRVRKPAVRRTAAKGAKNDDSDEDKPMLATHGGEAKKPGRRAARAKKEAAGPAASASLSASAEIKKSDESGDIDESKGPEKKEETEDNKMDKMKKVEKVEQVEKAEKVEKVEKVEMIMQSVEMDDDATPKKEETDDTE